jgi:hypothetical protein
MDSATRSYRYPESELELEPAPSDTSSVGGKREGWKTRSLREKFGIEPRRSLSASGSVVNAANGGSFTSSSRFRQSLPGTGHDNHRITNFAASRKRSAEEESDDEPGAKRQLGFYGSTTNGETANRSSKSTHWDLRARGFVPMPDGNWLPEAIVRSSSAANERGRASGRYDFASRSDTGSPDGLLDVDIDMASDAGGGRAPSPSPSELRLRLAKIAKPRSSAYGHASRHSVDLPRFGAQGLLSTSPPHPPFASTAAAAGSMPPPPLMRSRSSGDRTAAALGVGKRKRGSAEMDVDDDGDGGGDRERGREVSPSAKKKAVLGGGGGGGAVPDRAETNVMVENTKRMLRELRDAMDRADREEPGMRAEVYLEG